MIIKTLISIQPKLAHSYRAAQPKCRDHDMCFELLGFDVMIDDNLKPWLIEVNSMPSFGTDTEMDKEVKTGLIEDTFRLIETTSSDIERKIKNEEQSKKLRISGVNSKELLLIQLQEAEDYRKEKTLLDEKNQGGFQLIYPTQKNNSQYAKLMEAATEDWETFQGENSNSRLAQNLQK